MMSAHYLSPIDFHKLVSSLLKDHKAELSFIPNWRDPLPKILEKVELLPEILELLINIPGIDFNKRDEKGANLLFHAAKGNKLGNLQQLVNLGLDYSQEDSTKRSLLHEAAKFGDVKMVRYLLTLKLDPNSHDANNCTSLHQAARFGKLSIVEILVENGANVRAENINGETALHLTAKIPYPDTEILKYLVKNGAEVNDIDIDNYGNTPLHLSTWKEVSECLVEMGADIHAKNKGSKTPAQMQPWLHLFRNPAPYENSSKQS